MAHGDFSQTPVNPNSPDYFTCKGEVGQPCRNPLHRAAAVRISPMCFLPTCEVGDAYEGESIGTCGMCAAPVPKSALLAGNPALRALLLGRSNELVRPNFGSTLPPEVARLMATLFANRGETMVCAPCAEPGLARLREKGGFAMNGSIMLPFEQPPTAEAAPAPVAPGGVVKYTPPAAKASAMAKPTAPPAARENAVASKPQPPAVKAGPAKATPPAAAPQYSRRVRCYARTESELYAWCRRFREFELRYDDARAREVDGSCGVPADLCHCGGCDFPANFPHRDDTMALSSNRYVMAVGPGCLEALRREAGKRGEGEAFEGLLVSYQEARAKVDLYYRVRSSSPSPALRGGRFEEALRAVEKPAKSEEDLAKAAAARLARAKKRAARATDDALLRKAMKGKSGGGGGKKKNGRK